MVRGHLTSPFGYEVAGFRLDRLPGYFLRGYTDTEVFRVTRGCDFNHICLEAAGGGAGQVPRKVHLTK